MAGIKKDHIRRAEEWLHTGHMESPPGQNRVTPRGLPWSYGFSSEKRDLSKDVWLLQYCRTLSRRPTQVLPYGDHWSNLLLDYWELERDGEGGGAQSKQCSGLGKWHFCSYPCLSKDPGQQIWPFAELSRWPLLTRELRW